MGDWIDKLVKNGTLTSEEAGSNASPDGTGPTPVGERRITVSRSSSTSGQQDFWDRFPSLKKASDAPYRSPFTPSSKWTSAGGVVVRALTPDLIDFVYLVKPRGNGFGKLVFPKGRIETEKGETREHAATREVAEEAGILARIVFDGYLGSFEGSQSHTHYFLMYRVQDSRFGHDDEMEEVLCLHIDKALEELKAVGNRRDVEVLLKARERITEIKNQMAAQPVVKTEEK